LKVRLSLSYANFENLKRQTSNIQMFTVVAGTVLLAFVHALIPNHWLPLVAVARAEKWNLKELTGVTFISALAHVLGTVALGFVLGFIGKELKEEYGRAIAVASSLLLIVFGLIYYTVNLPHHHHSSQKDVAGYKRSRSKWILIFIIMMFLSPCLEVESLFLSAGVYGMWLVSVLSVIYAIVSISGIMLLVNLGFKGTQLLTAHFIEHNEKRISGVVLIVVGIVSFFLH
jgi:nickel/cobalt transporter (NicO) family protein